MPPVAADPTTDDGPAPVLSMSGARALDLCLTLVAVGVAAVVVDAEPVGLAVLDALYRAAFVASVAAGAARSNRWVRCVSALATAALAGSPAMIVLSIVTLALAVAGALATRDRIPGALIGAGVGLAALGLVDLGVFGLSSLFAVLVVAPLWISGLVNSSGRIRRRVAIVGAVIVVAGLTATGLGGLAALSARTEVGVGTESAREGLAQFREGDGASATGSLTRASETFANARDAASAWWALPARAVPVVGQHASALDRLSTDGAELTEVAARMADASRSDDLVRQGAIDLNRLARLSRDGSAVLDGLEGVLASSRSVRSGWLIPPVTERIDALTDEVASALPGTRHAVQALEVAPTLLGRDGSRRYLVLIGNPAEARELGGFVGTYGVLSARRGELDFTQITTADVSGRLRGLDDLAGRAVEPPEGLPPPLLSARPASFAQNWTAWPEFATVTRLADGLWEQYSGEGVDGVAYVDPYTLGALLEFTGPVRLADGTELTSDNAVDFMLRDQYLGYTDQQQERKNLLGDAAQEAFDRLLDEGFPSPGALVERLGPLVGARRLLFETTDGVADDLLDRTGLSGRIGDDDQVLVTSTNTRPNKLDSYLRRRISYDVDIDPATGRLDAVVSVALTNTADRRELNTYVTGAPEDGLGKLVNRTDTALYAPWELRRITLDGEPTSVNNLPAEGLRRYSTTIEVGGGETRTVRYHMRGRVPPDQSFALELVPTPTAVPDVVSAEVTRGGTEAVVASGPLSGSRRLMLP